MHVVDVTTQADGHFVLSAFCFQSLSSDSADESQRHFNVN